jgi:hypothetical protein
LAPSPIRLHLLGRFGAGVWWCWSPPVSGWWVGGILVGRWVVAWWGGSLAGLRASRWAGNGLPVLSVTWRRRPWARSSGCHSFRSLWCFTSAKCVSSVSARSQIPGAHSLRLCPSCHFGSPLPVFLFPDHQEVTRPPCHVLLPCYAVLPWTPSKGAKSPLTKTSKPMRETSLPSFKLIYFRYFL